MAGQTAMSTPIFDQLLREMAATSAATEPQTPEAQAATEATPTAAAATPATGRRRRPD